MLALLLLPCLCVAAPQQDLSVALQAAAVAVRGEPELSSAEALASARRKVEEQVRSELAERAQRTVEMDRPFWVPEILTREAVRRWLRDVPLGQVVRLVDREDREREHEFGSSYQTTLWIAEEPQQLSAAERQLRRNLRMLERSTAIKYGGTAVVWCLLAVLVGWLDRMSRGYMTGRLRFSGLLAGVAVPAIFFLL